MEAHKILWKFELQKDPLILARRPDLVRAKKKKKKKKKEKKRKVNRLTSRHFSPGKQLSENQRK